MAGCIDGITSATSIEQYRFLADEWNVVSRLDLEKPVFRYNKERYDDFDLYGTSLLRDGLNKKVMGYVKARSVQRFSRMIRYARLRMNWWA